MLHLAPVLERFRHRDLVGELQVAADRDSHGNACHANAERFQQAGQVDGRGLAHNTIVIFTSDNGGERFSDTSPFNGRKTELLEGGLRIPALVSWPARIPAGLIVGQQVTANMDWLPTLLARSWRSTWRRSTGRSASSRG